MPRLAATHPILTADETRGLETRLFGGDEAKAWAAMTRAGRAVAAAVRRDFAEIGGIPDRARLLVLVGKGNNGGDALIAAQAVLERFPGAGADVVPVFGVRPLRPLARRAWQALMHAARDRVAVRPAAALAGGYDLCLDGVFGFQFRPPADPRIAGLLAAVNALPIRLRAAVDLPSAGLFHADFTYATGAVKTPVLTDRHAGRLRYLDLGFFRAGAAGASRVLTAGVLAPLAALRAPHTDKRTYGHVFVLGGSRNYPGAVLMSVLAALHSGAGRVTAFVPESLVPVFAARAPEAIWVGWPETPGGGLALEGGHLLRERIDTAGALLMGPGLGRERETLALVADVVKTARVPLVLDADALQREAVHAAKTPLVLTPHAGEFARIAQGLALENYAAETGATVVLKGPVTRIANGAPATVYHSFFGGPVLARGGSGDLLAGLIAGLLAQTPAAPALAAARGVVWHGLAADLLARAHGQTAVLTTQLLDFLPAALREYPHEP
jgi:NAD(P)H-hydrate epimerase